MNKNILYRSDLEFNDSSEEKNKKVKGGGIVLIGPIPIVFGTSWKIMLILMILAIVIIFLLLLFLSF